jgi:hypothetical protein
VEVSGRGGEEPAGNRGLPRPHPVNADPARPAWMQVGIESDPGGRSPSDIYTPSPTPKRW